jgi:hypothetical protein
MVVGGSAECLICKNKFVLRVGIGLEHACTHTFDCPHCFSALTVVAKTGKPPQAHIEFIDNCRSLAAERTGPIVNLHPSIAFTAEEYHSPFTFPSIVLTELAMPHLRVPVNERVRDVASQFELPYTKELWNVVVNVIGLHLREGSQSVLDGQIAQYAEMRRRFLPEFACSTVFKCIASFFDDGFFPAIGNLRHPLRKLIGELRETYSGQIAAFEAYYQAELQSPNIERYMALFQDYFANFDQFRQLLVFARIDSEEVDELIVGGKNFNDVKMFYGQAYETLTSSYVMLACLNNIKKGRRFDEFEHMTLNKYIKDVEKAKKSKPFSGDPVLAAFANSEDSALRNGSHHASIARNGELIKYRSGGTGAEREMAYSRYIHMCNQIAITNSALMLVELQEFSTLVRK